LLGRRPERPGELKPRSQVGGSGIDTIKSKEFEWRAARAATEKQQVITEFIAPKMSHKISFSTDRTLLSRHTMTATATLMGVLEFAYRHAPPPTPASPGRRGGGIPPASGTSEP